MLCFFIARARFRCSQT